MSDVTIQPATARPARLGTAVLFTATIFLSASLLFFVQPLFTKIALPAIGGAPAVWTTAMLFFQTVLIGGYLYAHLLSRHLGVRAQMAVHLALWAAALAFLPLALPEGWRYDPGASVPVQTLGLYALGVGLPFAFLSANAPLIQSWYGKSGGPSAADPYFLYGASNLGSLIALLGFPLLAEPFLGAHTIGLGWAAGFVGLGLALAAGALWARGPVAAAAPENAPRGGAGLGAARMLWWAFLAFVPSSLMLGATTKISTDIGSFPLIWVLPLALYLLTFVLAFTNRPLLPLALLRPGFALALAALAVLSSGLWSPHLNWTMSGVLILAVFVATLMAHRVLYEARPEAGQLTVYYVVMSLGGACGGLFNSILAPLVFDRLLEYPITIALITLLMIGRRPANATSKRSATAPPSSVRQTPFSPRGPSVAFTSATAPATNARLRAPMTTAARTGSRACSGRAPRAAACSSRARPTMATWAGSPGAMPSANPSPTRRASVEPTACGSPALRDHRARASITPRSPTIDSTV